MTLLHSTSSDSIDHDVYYPKVNDYVKWKDLEGWVYFTSEEYITIEIAVKPMCDTEVSDSCGHKMHHCLVLCYHWNWNELIYVRSRSSKYETTDS